MVREYCIIEIIIGVFFKQTKQNGNKDVIWHLAVEFYFHLFSVPLISSFQTREVNFIKIPMHFHYEPQSLHRIKKEPFKITQKDETYPSLNTKIEEKKFK